MPKRRTNQVARARKRNMILNKGLEFFTSKGFTRTTISDITDSLELGKGTFYLYYSSKGHLFRACMRKVATAVQPQHLRHNIIDGQDFEQALYERMCSYCKAFQEISGIFMILRRSLKLEDSKYLYLRQARNYVCKLINPFVKDLEKASESGILRNTDVHSVSHLILVLAETIGYRLMFEQGLKFEETLKTYMDIIKYGIMKPGVNTLPQN